MALKSNALVTLAQANSFMGTSGIDTEVERLINSASELFEKRTNRKLVSQTYTEYHDGSRTNKILLRQWPILGGPADGATKPQVFVDGASLFPADSELAVNDYFVSDERTMLLRVTGMWPSGYRNIKVIYLSGLGTLLANDLPSDLQDACLQQIVWMYRLNTDRRLGIISKSKSGETVTYSQGIPAYIDVLLEPYMRAEFAVTNSPVQNG